MVLWRRWTACKDAWRPARTLGAANARRRTSLATWPASAGTYGRAAAENKGRYGIIASHRLDGRAVSAADALRNVTGGERTHRGVWNYHKATQNATDDETGQAGVKRRCIESNT